MSTPVKTRSQRKTQAIVPRSGPFGMGDRAAVLVAQAHTGVDLPLNGPPPVLDPELHAASDAKHEKNMARAYVEVFGFTEAQVKEWRAAYDGPPPDLAASPALHSVTATVYKLDSADGKLHLDPAAEAHLAAFNAAHDAENSPRDVPGPPPVLGPGTEKVPGPDGEGADPEREHPDGPNPPGSLDAPGPGTDNGDGDLLCRSCQRGDKASICLCVTPCGADVCQGQREDPS